MNTRITLQSFQMLTIWYLQISLLHVPNIMFSSIRKMCRPGKLLAQPRPTRSLMVDLCE